MKKLLFVLLLSFATTGFSQTTRANTRTQAYYHFSKARMLDDQGQGTQAIDEYKKALELDPNNSLIFSEMAESYLRNNRLREAVDVAQKAIQADRDNIEAHKILSTVYLQVIGRANAQQPPSTETINNAIHEFEEIIRIDPTERQSFLMLGRLYQIKGERDKAADIYKKFLGVEPGSEDGVTALAKLHMDAGNDKEAVELLENFVKQRPDSDSAFQTLGEAYSDMQEYAKAAEAYRRAIELDSDNVEIKKAEAQALYLANDIDNAAKKYEDLIKTEPEDGVARLRLGQSDRRQMKYDLARQNLEKASQAFPDSIEIQFNLVLLDRDEGRLEDALKLANDLLKKTEKANGRYTEAEKQNRRVFLINQAILNQTLGNYNEAVRTFTEVKSLTNEKDGRVDALIVETYRLGKNLDKALQQTDQALLETPASRQLRMLRADLVAEKGRVDEGIKALQQLQKGNEEDFRKALEIQKDDPAVLNYLGFMFADRGIRLEEAETMIQKAVQADPTNGAYLDSLGWVYFKLNRLDRAEEYLKKAIIFLNTDSNIHDHLGDLYFKTKRYDEARTEWNKTLQLSTEQEEIDRVKKKLDELKTTKAAKK